MSILLGIIAIVSAVLSGWSAFITARLVNEGEYHAAVFGAGIAIACALVAWVAW